MADLLTFAGAHPLVSVALVLAFSQVVAAPVAAWRKWTKAPGLCPRCHGTGREP